MAIRPEGGRTIDPRIVQDARYGSVIHRGNSIRNVPFADTAKRRAVEFVRKFNPFYREYVIGENFPLRNAITNLSPNEQSDVQSPLEPDLAEAPRRRKRREQEYQADFSPNLEKKERRSFRQVEAKDISGIMELFEDYASVRKSPNGRLEKDSDHAGHEDITTYIPENPNSPEQQELFRKALEVFYLGGAFQTTARYTGEPITVTRYSEVCVSTDSRGEEKVVGVVSALTDDPYASKKDRLRKEKKIIKPLYSHMGLVAPEYRGDKIMSLLIARQADRFMIRGDYTQLTGGVDKVGDWMNVLYTFESMGFQPDWRPEGKYRYVDKQGKEVEGQRVIMEKASWIEEYAKKVYNSAIAILGDPLNSQK